MRPLFFAAALSALGCSDPPSVIMVDCKRTTQADGSVAVDCGNNGDENITIYGDNNPVDQGAGGQAPDGSSQVISCSIPQVIPCLASVCSEHDYWCKSDGLCPSGYNVVLAAPAVQDNCLRTLEKACGLEIHCCPTQQCPALIHCDSDDDAWWQCPGAECVLAVCEAEHCALGQYNSALCPKIN